MYYDFDDLDMSGGMYGYGMGTMGLGGSIFNGYMTPMMGNAQSYFDNMKQYQKFNIEYNIDQQKMSRNADMRIYASVEGIKNAAAVLKDKIMANEQDQIQEAYDKYVDAVAAAYGEGTQAEIKARASTLYASMNNNKSLIDDLREYSHGSTTQGFIQSLTFGTYNKNSVEDNISYITGSPVNIGEKTKQNTGRVLGALTIGGVVGGLVKALGKSASKTGATGANTLSASATKAATKGGFVKALGKSATKAGAVGAIVGGVALLMSFITGKVST
jgi:hypothetical protein